MSKRYSFMSFVLALVALTACHQPAGAMESGDFLKLNAAIIFGAAIGASVGYAASQNTALGCFLTGYRGHQRFAEQIIQLEEQSNERYMQREREFLAHREQEIYNLKENFIANRKIVRAMQREKTPNNITLQHNQEMIFGFMDASKEQVRAKIRKREDRAQAIRTKVAEAQPRMAANLAWQRNDLARTEELARSRGRFVLSVLFSAVGAAVGGTTYAAFASHKGQS